jgi:predicted lysophospholipase L1 biosynthesis ABC-type transport system permease subunit
MKTRIINKVLTVVLLLTTSLSVWADALPTPSPSFFPINPNGGEDEPADASVDQITIWLLITAVLLAVYHMKFRNKEDIKE